MCYRMMLSLTLNIVFLSHIIDKTAALCTKLEMPIVNETLSKEFIDLNQKNKIDPELCEDPSFNTILSYKNETFVLKGDRYWKIGNNSVALGYPRPISEKWPGLPGSVDTSFTDFNDTFLYFFKGSKYWKYEDDKLQNGYPRDIGVDFVGLPDNLQAATLGFSHSNYLYFFKGYLYWRYDVSKEPYEITQGLFPAQIAIAWGGIPPNVDCIVRSSTDKSIYYFFKEGRYYKYNEVKDAVIKDYPPYPRRTASHWFGCPKVFTVTVALE